jgi:hypothetical protein
MTSGRQISLNYKECFELWYKLTTTTRVAEYYANLGIVSPITGKPHSYNAIYSAANKYIIQCPDEARKIFSEAGINFTDEEWNIYVVRKTLRYIVTSKKAFMDALKRNNLDGDEYKYIYAKQYNLR